MQFDKAEKFVSGLLQSGIPPSLYYHNYFHTLDVLNATMEIAKEENITDEEDITILKTAALFHDCGFVHIYKNHEEEGCRMAREILPRFDYSEDQIAVICNIILKTKYPETPQTHLEKILCDADLDYLGRDDFEIIGKKLFKEWMEIGKVHNENEWNTQQVKFLESHRYWTKSAIAKREKKKEEHLQKLKSETK